MTATEKYAELIKEKDSRSRPGVTQTYSIRVDPLERANIAAAHIIEALFTSIPVARLAIKIGKDIARDLDREDPKLTETAMKIGINAIQPLDDYGIVKLEMGSDVIKTDPDLQRANLYDEWAQMRSRSKKKLRDNLPYMLRARKSLKAVEFLDKLTAEVRLFNYLDESRLVFRNEPLQWKGIRHPDFGSLVSNMNAKAIPLFNNPKFKRSLDAVNKLQSTPFFINKAVLVRLKEDRREIVRKLKADADSSDSFTSKLYNLDRTLGLAEEHVGSSLYSPVFLDNRGRTYYGSSYLSRSGDDFNKGLLGVEPEEIGDKGWDNLLVGAIDFRDKGAEAKMSYANKLALAESQIDEFVGVANGDSYLHATEMAQYLAVCIDIRNALDLGVNFDKYKSGVLLSRDASQSGPMLMGIMTQDHNTMKFTNVLNDTERNDLYENLGAQMLKELKAYKPKEFKEYTPAQGDDNFNTSLYLVRNHNRVEADARARFLDMFEKHPEQIRKWSKYPLMLFGYSGESATIGKDLWNKFRHSHDWLTPTACFMLADIYYNSCKTAIPAVYQFMVGMKKLGGIVHKLNEDVTNITPYSGFPFMQRYYKFKSEKARPVYKGKRLNLRYLEVTDKRDYHKTKSATAANFVHSIDADLLKMVVNKFPHTIATNHDAFFATAARIDELGEVLRECTKSFGTEFKPLRTLTDAYNVAPEDIGIHINELHPDFSPENNEFCYS